MLLLFNVLHFYFPHGDIILSFTDIFQLFMALEALNTVGVIHTDIKPDNIMFANWYDLSIKLIDFGLAVLDTDAVAGHELQAIRFRYCCR